MPTDNDVDVVPVIVLWCVLLRLVSALVCMLVPALVGRAGWHSSLRLQQEEETMNFQDMFRLLQVYPA